MSQKFAAYDSSGTITAYYDSEVSPVPTGVNAIKISAAEWQECITTQGYTVSNGALVAPTAPSADDLLEAAQSSQIASLTYAYQSATQQPVSFSTSAGVSKTFQADSNSQSVLLLATTGYNLQGATPDGFYWVASDNSKVPFVLDDLKGLYGVMLSQGNAAFQKLQDLKASVRSAKTVSAVQEVVWV